MLNFITFCSTSNGFEKIVKSFNSRINLTYSNFNHQMFFSELIQFTSRKKWKFSFVI